MKARSGWNWNSYDNVSGNGTDDFGFSALPGGTRGSGSSFDNAGYYGNWWAATEDGAGNAYYRGMIYGIDVVGEDDYDKSNGFSVRCVADN